MLPTRQCKTYFSLQFVLSNQRFELYKFFRVIVKLSANDRAQASVKTYDVKSSLEAEDKIAREAVKSKRRNRQVRLQANYNIMILKKKAKKLRNQERQKLREAHGEILYPKMEPRTIESMRVPDPTFEENLTEEQLEAEKNDETLDYFTNRYKPKLLITSPHFPSKTTRLFCREMLKVFPNSTLLYRKATPLHKVCTDAYKHGYSDVIDVFVPRKAKLPTSLIYAHLPEGPSIHFRLSGITFMKDIPDKFPGSVNNPELILTNFKTAQGRRLARLFAILFPSDPDFRKRQVVVFHNQRDFVFFRRYKYAFRKEGEKVVLKEVGPRFTLKNRKLLKGLPKFDNDNVEYEYNPHQFVKNKKLFAN